MFMYGPDLHVDKRVESLTFDSPIAMNVSPYVPEMGPISLYAAEHFPRLVYMAQNIQTPRADALRELPPRARE
jgi:hypothetical protein